MASLAPATELVELGKYRSALEALNEERGSIENVDAALLKVQILERLGRHGEGGGLGEYLLRRKSLTAAARSTCEFVLGRIKLDEGDTTSAVAYLQRAESLAIESGNRTLLCWHQLWIWQFLANQSATEATA